jgi:hypothetical protein
MVALRKFDEAVAAYPEDEVTAGNDRLIITPLELAPKNYSLNDIAEFITEVQ